eukprot:gene18368-24840_t
MAGSSIESKACTRDGCGKPLTGRRTKFCSDECQKGKSRVITPTAGGTKVQEMAASPVPIKVCMRDGCGETLTGRRTKFCSDECQKGKSRVITPTAGGAKVPCSDKCQEGKPIGRREPQSKQTTEKPHAEELAGRLEEIAQGFVGIDNKALLIVNKGQMDQDWRELRASVPDVPGNYIWTIKAPNAQKWVPVYIGEAKKSLRSRFYSYINEDHFGPKAEHRKCWPMVDAMSRGFSIEVRFRTGLKDPHGSEDRALMAYDFALNSSKNGGYRNIELPTKNKESLADYPVLNDGLGLLADCFRHIAEYK